MITLPEQMTLERVRVPVWAWALAALAALAVYLVALENGAVLAQGAETVHELFHDARHFVAVPCH